MLTTDHDDDWTPPPPPGGAWTVLGLPVALITYGNYLDHTGRGEISDTWVLCIDDNDALAALAGPEGEATGRRATPAHGSGEAPQPGVPPTASADLPGPPELRAAALEWLAVRRDLAAHRLSRTTAPDDLIRRLGQASIELDRQLVTLIGGLLKPTPDPDALYCGWCHQPFTRKSRTGPPPRFCSDAHRQAHHRAEHAGAT